MHGPEVTASETVVHGPAVTASETVVHGPAVTACVTVVHLQGSPVTPVTVVHVCQWDSA